MAIELTREERDAVRGAILTTLTGLGDFTYLIDKGQVTKARRLGEKFNDCVTLLDDLGWADDDERDSFELTGTPHQLARILPKLQLDIVGALTSEIMETRSNQHGMERSAVASTFFLRAVDELESTHECDAEHTPPTAA